MKNKDTTTKKLQAYIIDEDRHKNPQENSSKKNTTTHYKDYTP